MNKNKAVARTRTTKDTNKGKRISRNNILLHQDHKMPIYYGWRWHGILTPERQTYSNNPGGTPRQCISVRPWKLAQPIAGYRRNTRLILNPQWHKRLLAAYFYFLFVLALFAKYLILFSRITGIRRLTWLILVSCVLQSKKMPHRGKVPCSSTE